MSDFKNSKEELPGKEKFYNLLTDKKITVKEYQRTVNVLNKFKMQTMSITTCI